MTNHVAQPALCADCLSIIHVLAEAGAPDDRVRSNGVSTTA